jgi:urease accessory protein
MMTRFTLLALPVALLATPAFAHIGVHDAATFADGAAHPLTGLDHIAVMVAVGLWAALKGGKALFAWPLAFVGAMIIGSLVGPQAGLPFVEPVILASVVTIGLLVALAVDLPVALGAALIAVFAVFHGAAHGAEAGENNLNYIAGFALTTAALHLAGIAAGFGLQSVKLKPIVRVAGAGCALTGVALAAQLV